MRKSFNEDWRC